MFAHDEADAMTTEVHLRVSRADLLLEAHAVAELVEKHADRLSAATGGRIAAGTAIELRALAARASQLHAQTPSRRVGKVRPLVLEACRAMTRIRDAIAYAHGADPAIAQELRALTASDTRSVDRVTLDLQRHLALLDDEARALLPTILLDRLPVILRELEARDEGKLAEDARRVAHRTELRAADLRLDRWVRDIRKVLALTEPP